ncbi:EAL domain-containing protein [Janthinobacterium lividum]|uniref:EAL domain-containing protein n=1 Tax=Janthinobacterium lividum TaxID=29581 RepID=UPI00140A2404|nr:EAL domain-containing protein [Janthinobacterium lividum]NHQ93868.1 EAL domain-containing protein [Janthinobacterium lividum]
MSATVYAIPSNMVHQRLPCLTMPDVVPQEHKQQLQAPKHSPPARPSDADVLHAICTGEGLRVLYQPQYDLHSRRIVSAEALLRWQHPRFGNVPPTVLIPMVNRLGLHQQLFDWVVKEVIDVLYYLRRQDADVPVAVNASIDTVCEPGMADLLAMKMGHACLPTRLLKVEVTEDLPVLDELRLSGCLNTLRAKGFSLSLDDFGAGSATFNVLFKMPFDEVKIDGAFVRDMETNSHSYAIVATLVSLAQRLNLKLVAEGIESESLLKALLGIGCRIGQGYALARPMEREEFLQGQLAAPGIVAAKAE